jgi:hypothetical protein
MQRTSRLRTSGAATCKWRLTACVAYAAGSRLARICEPNRVIKNKMIFY